MNIDLLGHSNGVETSSKSTEKLRINRERQMKVKDRIGTKWMLFWAQNQLHSPIVMYAYVITIISFVYVISCFLFVRIYIYICVCCKDYKKKNIA